MDARDFRIALKTRKEIDFFDPAFVGFTALDAMYEQAKTLTYFYNKQQHEKGSDQFMSAALVNASALLHLLYQELISNYLETKNKTFFTSFIPKITQKQLDDSVLNFYAKEFPSPLLESLKPTPSLLAEETSRGFFVHWVMLENKALVKAATPLIKPKGLDFPLTTAVLIDLLVEHSQTEIAVDSSGEDLFEFLLQPARLHPNSLSAQIEYILKAWGDLLSEQLKIYLLRAIDYVKEEQKVRIGFGGGGAPTQVLSFSATKDIEYEAYSSDSNWMPNVVMLAKSTLVWLDQLSKTYGYSINTLDQIPDYELDLLAERGFTSLWLIGLWERSTASKKIKNLCGNPEAEASAYSLHSYDIAQSIGGWSALHNLDQRCRQRGIRLASDMVPNHTGLDSDWLLNHPDYFIRSFRAPFPSYTYNGENLSEDPRYDIRIEDHYYDQTDAAVTFRRIDNQTQEVSYVFHGNDGTSMPWNDTAQIDFLNPEAREAVIQQILHVARNFHVIRFDAAMTLAKRHVQRLWYPQPGSGGDIPGRADYGMSDAEFSARMPIEFWREVVDRVAVEVPDTLLLAEAFWMMEGYFVRTLGMHRVYNSAFMNMLKNEENKKYRDTIKNTLSFDPEILKRFVNFMNNPDEETAIAQFGSGDKYFGVCTLLSTMPGLPMFGHGQIEGFKEKYGMEYQRAYWNEYPDQHLVSEHYKRIFPLLKLRWQFSESDYFELFDAVDNHMVSEAIFAYVNGTATHRNLVLYNNRYEMSQGRIFESATKMVRTDDGNRISRTISLGESLNLTMRRHRFMLYENFSDKLTYIIPSIAIFDEGYWVSLMGYEVRILLNIREVEDVDEVYEKLYQLLGGNGTANLERDLMAIRLQSTHKAMENFASSEMLDFIKMVVSGEKVSGKDVRKFVLLTGESYARVAALYESLTESQLKELPSLQREVQPREILDEMQNFIDCFSFNNGSELYRNGAVIMEELIYIFQTALLIKQFVKVDYPLNEIGETISKLMVEKLFVGGPALSHMDEFSFGEHLQKAALLVCGIDIFEKELLKEAPNAKESLTLLLENDFFRRSIGYNVYRGEIYYRKESFQETLYLLALGYSLRSGKCEQKLVEILTSFMKADLISDYKVNLLLSHLN
jgi:glycosidase